MTSEQWPEQRIFEVLVWETKRNAVMRPNGSMTSRDSDAEGARRFTAPARLAEGAFWWSGCFKRPRISGTTKQIYSGS